MSSEFVCDHEELPFTEATFISIIFIMLTWTLVCMAATSPNNATRSRSPSVGRSDTEDDDVELCDRSYLIPQDDLLDHTIEAIPGSKVGSTWYVLDDTYILYKIDTSVDGSEVFLECSRRRHGRCPFKAAVSIQEDGNLKLNYMYSLDRHHCDQDGVEVVVQSSKLL